MKLSAKILAAAVAAAMAVSGCGASAVSTSSQTGSAASSGTSSTASSEASSASSGSTASAADSSSLKLDDTKWNFDSANNAYWQIGLAYCTSPEDTNYESMGIYVPAAYMTAKDNGDGTYTCTVNKSGTVGSFTGEDAPMVLPVETPGYAAIPAPTQFSYDSVSSYLEAGYVFLNPGCRGNSGSMGHAGMSTQTAAGTASGTTASAASSTSSTAAAAQSGAPWGVTDIKAAIRYVRYNSSSVPGDSSKIFCYGMSGGGAQTSLLGTTGDSPLYTPYLNKIGAAMTDDSGAAISDAICGAMCWCPVTSLDIADEAYEWMMGQCVTTDTRADGTFTAALSKDMAAVFADYINKLGLTDSQGNALTLSSSASGVDLAGTYYDYIKSTIETSLNNFLSDTTFPYTPSSQSSVMGGMGVMGGGGRPTMSGAPSDMSGLPDMSGASGLPDMSGASGMPSGASGTAMSGTASGSTASASSATYNTAQEYIDSLNGTSPWITYDAASNTATISSMEAFVQNCKTPTKGVCAFDSLDLSTAENNVFGDASNTPEHFDSYLAGLLSENQSKYASLSGWDASYVTDYANIASVTDELSTSTEVRGNMYDPIYFAAKTCAGSGTSTIAPYWRIRTGIFQGDTSLTTETNLALALQSCSSVKDVDFATVWGQYHTMAERSGDSTSNFISWVAQCCEK